MSSKWCILEVSLDEIQGAIWQICLLHTCWMLYSLTAADQVGSAIKSSCTSGLTTLVLVVVWCSLSQFLKLENHSESRHFFASRAYAPIQPFGVQIASL